MRKIITAIFIGIVIPIGCNSGDTEIKTVVNSIVASGCKTTYGGSVSFQDLGNLRCVTWFVEESNRLVISLTDFVESCGVPESYWVADVKQTSVETANIQIIWNFPTPNICISCEQDFLIRVDGLQLKGLKSLDIETKSCTGQCPVKKYSVNLGTPVEDTKKVCGDSVVKI